jgi:opacity protein-like surface antigen
MKNIFKSFVFVGIAAMVSTAAIAQQDLRLSVNYNIAKPIGAGFKDYVSNTSFRGMQASLLYGINEQVNVGLQIGYNDFYQKYPRALYKTEDGSDISTVLSNTLQTIPVVAKGTYSFAKTGFVRPYAGVGAGLNLINYDQYYGEFKYSEQYLKPAFTVDAGLLFPISSDSRYGLRLSTAYNFQPFNKEGIKNLDTWNVQAGFFIPLK